MYLDIHSDFILAKFMVGKNARANDSHTMLKQKKKKKRRASLNQSHETKMSKRQKNNCCFNYFCVKFVEKF